LRRGSDSVAGGNRLSSGKEHGGPDAKAIDSHAKNFSLFLTPDGYTLTPLYDVISAHPWFGKGFEPRKTKMAMSVRGSKNKHYRWFDILPRHWLSHARYLGINTGVAQRWLAECVERTPASLQRVIMHLPEHFNRDVGERITQGILQTLARYQHHQLAEEAKRMR
jgi:serine/threonine-protein kinase HipA